MKTFTIQTSSVSKEERRKLALRAGDTVKVWQRIEEIKIGKAANKKEAKTKSSRLQAFEGLVLARKHGEEAGATFTVRKVASGVGVEKVFPLYSPMIEKIEIIKRGGSRRAKLYHIREKVAREVKRQMRKARFVDAVAPEAQAPEAPAQPEPVEKIAAVQ